MGLSKYHEYNKNKCLGTATSHIWSPGLLLVQTCLKCYQPRVLNKR